MKTLPAIYTDADHAYTVDDYLYGFRLRCKIRYWLEYRRGHGFHVASQTSNPKKPDNPWNKPKVSIYSPFAVLILDDIGHVQCVGVSVYDLEALEDFAVLHAEALNTDAHQSALKYYRAVQVCRAARASIIAQVAHVRAPGYDPTCALCDAGEVHEH
jgi:hypothetical protein